MTDIKQNILNDARKLFMQFGIKSVTMSDIAKHLGISKKTLYTHYQNKEELVEDGMQIHLGEEKNKICELKDQQNNAIDQMLGYSKFIYEHLSDLNPSLIYDLQKYYSKVWQKFEKYEADFIYNVILENLKLGIDQGWYRNDFNEKIVAKLYIGKSELILDQELFPKNEFEIIEVYKEHVMYHLNSVLSEKGKKYFNKNSENK